MSLSDMTAIDKIPASAMSDLVNKLKNVKPNTTRIVNGPIVAVDRMMIMKGRITNPDLDSGLYDKSGNYVFKYDYNSSTATSPSDAKAGTSASGNTNTTAGQAETSNKTDDYLLNADLPVDNKLVQNCLTSDGFIIPEGMKLNIQVVSSDPLTGYQFKVTGSGDSRFDNLVSRDLSQNSLTAGNAIIDALKLYNPDFTAQTNKLAAEGIVQQYEGAGADINTLSVQNGKIVGATNELKDMIDAKSPADMVKAMYSDPSSYSGDAQTLYDGVQNQLNLLKGVLEVGPNNIPDLTGSLVYTGGKLYSAQA